jgi:hypothetical protein
VAARDCLELNGMGHMVASKFHVLCTILPLGEEEGPRHVISSVLRPPLGFKGQRVCIWHLDFGRPDSHKVPLILFLVTMKELFIVTSLWISALSSSFWKNVTS